MYFVLLMCTCTTENTIAEKNDVLTLQLTGYVGLIAINGHFLYRIDV